MSNKTDLDLIDDEEEAAGLADLTMKWERKIAVLGKQKQLYQQASMSILSIDNRASELEKTILNNDPNLYKYFGELQGMIAELRKVLMDGGWQDAIDELSIIGSGEIHGKDE